MLLAILQRHEAYECIQLVPQPRGPKSGAIRNTDIREKVKKLMSDCKKQNKKINRAEFARKLDITRQYASKLVKEITDSYN